MRGDGDDDVFQLSRFLYRGRISHPHAELTVGHTSKDTPVANCRQALAVGELHMLPRESDPSLCTVIMLITKITQLELAKPMACHEKFSTICVGSCLHIRSEAHTTKTLRNACGRTHGPSEWVLDHRTSECLPARSN